MAKVYHRTRGRAGLAAGILIALGYVVARFFIYRMFPTGSVEKIPGVGVMYRPGPYEWWVRDTIMDVPRLLMFTLALLAGRYFWGMRQIGWHASRPVLGLIGGAVIVAFVLSGVAFRARPFDLLLHQLLIVSVSSLIVAASEETLFRGVIFRALHDWRGATVAMWGSAALFTVYHVQAQPLHGWPPIFLTGLFAAVLRWQGVGLAWLIGGHAAADALVYLGGQGPVRVTWWPTLALALQLAVVIGYYLSATRSKLLAGPPATPAR